LGNANCAPRACLFFSNRTPAAADLGTQIRFAMSYIKGVDRSIDTVTFKRGMNAHNHPGFYRQLGTLTN
jgi:hypothetical protein